MNTHPSDHSYYQASLRVRKDELKLTLLPDARLSRRLFAELLFAAGRFKENWPKFKEDPVGTITRARSAFVAAARRTIARPQTAFALATSVLILTSTIVAVLVLERHAGTRRPEDETPQLETVTTFDFASNSENVKDRGIGAGEKGRVGFARGSGEGSRPQPARSHGGGGGGDQSLRSASRGRIPLPSTIPAPIPTAAVHLPQALPIGGIDLDPALWRKLDYSTYGDPRSKQVTSSNGPGNGGGVGNGNRTGIGEGDGAGFGPGRDGNMGDGSRQPGGGGSGGSPGDNPNDDESHRVYKPPEVSTRPRVISKPEPQYTEEARRNQITGTVVLRVVFSSDGQVTNIQTMQKLGGGLTEKAIVAARQIRFVPATRNGHPVSMYMQLEYNFNLY